MSRMTAALLSGCLALLPAPSAAQELQRRVSMEEALELFLKGSLALQIARAEALEAKGASRQSRAYFNPTFTVIHEALDADQQEYWETTLGLEQRLEWPGRTASRSRAAAYEISAADARFRHDSLRLAFEVRRAYVEAWSAEERERLMRVATEVIERVVRMAESRYSEGDISGYELQRLRLERTRNAHDLAEIVLRSSARRRTLAALVLPDSETVEVGPSEPLAGRPPSISRSTAMATLPTRPDVEAAERSRDAAQAALSAASSGWVPDPTVSVGFKDQADGFSGLAFGLGVPLPLFDRRGGAGEAARARWEAAGAGLELHRRRARADVLAAFERHASTRQRLARGKGLFEEADTLLQTAETAYAEGELDLLELLDAARFYRDAGSAAVSLLAEAWIAFYDLLRATGRAPEDIR